MQTAAVLIVPYKEGKESDEERELQIRLHMAKKKGGAYPGVNDVRTLVKKGKKRLQSHCIPQLRRGKSG